MTGRPSGSEFLAAVMSPQCGETIWVKNTGNFGSSVNNGVGNCITARLVDQEGGGSVGKLMLSAKVALLVQRKV